MPDRDYYLDDSPRMATIREQYLAHVERGAQLAGSADAHAKAARIIELEHADRGRARKPRESLRGCPQGQQPLAQHDFSKRARRDSTGAPSSARRGLTGRAISSVWQPAAVTGISALVARAAARHLEGVSDLPRHRARRGLPAKAFVDERFAFHGQSACRARQHLRERWKRGIDATNAALGEAVGKLYVRALFPRRREGPRRGDGEELMTAFGERIEARLDVARRPRSRRRRSSPR